MAGMTSLDSLSLAWRTVRANKLRTSITVAIIAFGIMALIGIITAIEDMNQSLKESFSSMGTNAFNIRYKNSRVRMGGNNSDVAKSVRGQKEKKSNLCLYLNKREKRWEKHLYRRYTFL